MANPLIVQERTTPYDDQKPGTSGLRKKVKVFGQKNYLANFIQSVFNALPQEAYVGKTILCSGDGRYYSEEAIQTIAEIAAGNGVSRLWVGEKGWCSTPAASAIIRNREGGICNGGFILTASHNPGGPNEDFGVKYNCENGGPAPEQVTDAIFRESLKVDLIRKIPLAKLDLTKLSKVEMSKGFEVEVIDTVEDWMAIMKSTFDFEMIKSLVTDPKFSFVFDGMNGIGGPYGKAIFIDEFGCSPNVCERSDPKEDFGGLHPDPNLTYAAELVATMKVNQPSESSSAPDFGTSVDGDADRNMILGRGWFVTPSDSVAIIASYAERCIPYFKGGIKGVARSMPTSKALDNVAAKKGWKLFEVPTGWKYFGNLMDAGMMSICGEESFGTGSDHIREKDGLWAVLAWLSILAYRKKSGESVSVEDVTKEFWKEFGRNYYMRYDYEGISNDECDGVMAVGSAISGDSGHPLVSSNSNFCYSDPVDKSESPNQGVIIQMGEDKRCILRKSGTGSSGATLRIYFEVKDSGDNLYSDAKDYMKEFNTSMVQALKVEEITKRKTPTVIT